MAFGSGDFAPSRLAEELRGISFPTNKQSLLAHARRQELDSAILKLLNGLPDKDYISMADIMKGANQATGTL